MALWYLSRGTGAVALVLLTLTVVLGVLGRRRWAPAGSPRFLVEGLHRSAALLVVVLLVLHVGSVVLDDYVHVRLLDALVPFVGTYHPLWLGLGALAVDLLAALVVTSLLRERLGVRAWRAVHWAAYACWPVALAHGVGIGTDAAGGGWMFWLAAGCAVAVLLALRTRLAAPPADARPLVPVRSSRKAHR